MERVLYFLDPIPINVDHSLILGLTVLIVALFILGSSYAARKAAEIDPNEALRAP